MVVGDVVAEDVVRRLEEAIGGWTARAEVEVEVPTPLHRKRSTRTSRSPEKLQSDLVLGAVSIRRKDPDFQALRMANMILGRLGMMGRLGETVREEKGLAYGVHSELDAGIGAGPWAVRAGVNPSNVDTRWRASGMSWRVCAKVASPQELDRGQSYSTGSLGLHLETNDGVAGLIQDIELFDLGLDYADRYAGIINALTLDEVNRVRRSASRGSRTRCALWPARRGER